MKLLEREIYLHTLTQRYTSVAKTSGHIILIAGEAGIGKTSLINAFVKQVENTAKVLVGTCDSLFTPRPLGPLFDIVSQLSTGFQHQLKLGADRSVLLSDFLAELKRIEQTIILIFEDIHWADEATLDLIKFLSRRIDKVNCLFILSYRDDEIDVNHHIRTIHGEIPTNHLTRLKIEKLSLAAVKELSKNTGRNAEEVYKLTEGNPFYVTEILANQSVGIPHNIKDSIVKLFYRLPENIRQFCELISVFQGKVNVKFLELIEFDSHKDIETGLQLGILKMENNFLLLKHDLYRKTIEEALPSYKRIKLNEKILEALLAHPDMVDDLSVLVNHAINAQNYMAVVEFAPQAAKNASAHNAHKEAAKLYLTAIQYSDCSDKNRLATLYEQYAHECYLTAQIKTAIEWQQQALLIRKKIGELTTIASSLRILSYLKLLDGKQKDAEKYGFEAIETLKTTDALHETARAYCNYTYLKIFSHENEEAMKFGQKAIELAKDVNDKEILCQALVNIGSIVFQWERQNLHYLHEGLEIALRNRYLEQIVRGYAHIASISIEHKLYDEGEKYINEGINYCIKRDLDSGIYYFLDWKARLLFERCSWAEAEAIARNMINDPAHFSLVRMGSLAIISRILFRKGHFTEGLALLEEAKEMALESMTLRRIIPVVIAFLEYGWIRDDHKIWKPIVNTALSLLEKTFIEHYYTELTYWLNKNKVPLHHYKIVKGSSKSSVSYNWEETSEQWKRLGCDYEYALSLMDGPEDAQRRAISLLNQLGAFGTLEHLKKQMRKNGVSNIPKGPRISTKNNPANLTQRQVDVLRLISEGLQNTQIAEQLFISVRTVDNHIHAIFSKLNVHSRNKAVDEAVKFGLLS